MAAEPPPEPPSPPKWTGSVTFGATVTDGNSDTVLFLLGARAEKKWDRNELSLGSAAGYGESDSEKNNEFVSGFGQFNRLFNDRVYGYMRAEALHDDIADVQYRITLSPGVGYYFIKNTNTQFSAEIGPGFVIEKQGHDSTGYFTLRVGEKFEHKFNDRVRVWQSAEILPQVDDFENFLINAEVGVESALTKSWTLRVVLQDTYDNDPAEGRKGNDLKLIAGVGWKF